MALSLPLGPKVVLPVAGEPEQKGGIGVLLADGRWHLGSGFAALNGLQRQVIDAEFPHVAHFDVILVVMALLVHHQTLEQFLRHAVGARAALVGPEIVVQGAVQFHLPRHHQHLVDLLHRRHLARGLHHHVAAEEQDALGEPLDVQHFLDGGPLEQAGQQVVALVVAVKMKVHVLMEGGNFLAHRLVEQLDAVLVHTDHPCVDWNGEKVVFSIIPARLSADNRKRAGRTIPVNDHTSAEGGGRLHRRLARGDAERRGHALAIGRISLEAVANVADFV